MLCLQQKIVFSVGNMGSTFPASRYLKTAKGIPFTFFVMV